VYQVGTNKGIVASCWLIYLKKNNRFISLHFENRTRHVESLYAKNLDFFCLVYVAHCVFEREEHPYMTSDISTDSVFFL